MAQLSIDPKQSEIFNRLSQLGTEAFNTYYEQIGSPAMSASELGNLKNAFGHAYSSAWLAYNIDTDTAKIFGLIKEIFTLNQEVENHSLNGTDYARGHEIAYKDGSRDMWNNDLGIQYSQNALKNNESFESVSKKIFDNIYANKDFIVDYDTNQNHWKNVDNFDSYKNELYKDALSIGVELSCENLLFPGKILLDLVRNTVKIKIKLNEKQSEATLINLLNELNTLNMLNDNVVADKIINGDSNENYDIRKTSDIVNKFGISVDELINKNDFLTERVASDKSFALIRPDERIIIPEGSIKGTDNSSMTKYLNDALNGDIHADTIAPSGVTLPSSGKTSNTTVEHYTSKPQMMSQNDIFLRALKEGNIEALKKVIPNADKNLLNVLRFFATIPGNPLQNTNINQTLNN